MLQMSVKDYFNFGPAVPSGHVGIEIEVEAMRELPLRDLPEPWRIHVEDSLRGNAAEYVTKIPLYCNDGSKLPILQDLGKLLAPSRLRQNSHRTSVHVHVNVLDFTLLQVYNVITVYWLLENLLMEFCGNHRVGNHFCLRIKDADYLIGMLTKTLAEGNHFLSFMEAPGVRYSALNLASVSKFGSLEFRGMRGTSDMALIDDWSTDLWSFAHNCKGFDNPEAIFDYYFLTDKKRFLRTFLTDEFIVKLTRTRDNWEALIEENTDLISPFAYCIDWKRLERDTFVGPVQPPGIRPPVLNLSRDASERMDEILRTTDALPEEEEPSWHDESEEEVSITYNPIPLEGTTMATQLEPGSIFRDGQARQLQERATNYTATEIRGRTDNDE